MSDSKLSSEIVLRSGEEEARLPDIARPILQALHNSLIGLEETLKVRLLRPTICTVADIEQLIHLLSQWINTYGPISSSAQISCISIGRDRLRGDKRLSYKSMESFIQNYLGITDSTKSVTVKFVSILKLPESDTLDRVTLALELRGGTSRRYCVPGELWIKE